MPTAPPSRCLVARCPGWAYRRGRCTEHYRPWEQRSAHGNTIPRKAREAFRRAVLRMDPVCRACGTAPATEADHIIPIADGGAHHIDNGQGLCTPCHDKKTRAESAARNRARANKRSPRP